MRCRFFLALLVLLTLGFAESNAQEQGVLVGLRVLEPLPKPLPYYTTEGDSLYKSTYRTVLITKSGSDFALTGTVDALLVPRPRSFWRVGTKRSVYNNWIEDFVWSAPEGTTPNYAGIQSFNGEYCDGHRVFDIQFVSPRFISYEQRSSGYCEGATHPWFFNTLAVIPIDSTVHAGLEINEVLGLQAAAAFQSATAAFLNTLEDEHQRAWYTPTPDLANWALVHQQGRWRLKGRLDNLDESSQGRFADLALPLPIASTLLERPQASLAWNTIVAAVPSARDAIVAPDRSWVLLFHRNRLSIRLLDGDVLSEEVFTVSIPPNARIVMEQWAPPQRLRLWQQHIERLTTSLTSASD